MATYARKTDANQRAVVAAMRGLGAYVIPVAGYAACGFDLLVGWRGQWIPVEVKDGSRPPSARKLTPGEKVRRADCERSGLPYAVVASVDEALALLGAHSEFDVDKAYFQNWDY